MKNFKEPIEIFDWSKLLSTSLHAFTGIYKTFSSVGFKVNGGGFRNSIVKKVNACSSVLYIYRNRRYF